MVDVPFTLRAYEKIGARSARRGNDIALREPGVRKAVNELVTARKLHREKVKSIRLSKTKQLEQKLQDEKFRYAAERNSLRESRNIAVRLAHEKALKRLNRELREDAFSWQLSIGPMVGNRQTYEISNEFYHRIAAKQVEVCLGVATRRFQPSRHSIVASLKQALEKPFSYGVVRLDISKFFDSVPHDKLSEIVGSNSRIDSITKKLVNKLIAEYSDLADQTNGIPQGVGISSKLADAFLRRIDDQLVTDPRVSFYARFVDDIIVITKEPESIAGLEHDSIELLENIGLKVNSEKSITFQTEDDGAFPATVPKFEYLGYQFTKPSKTSLTVCLSDARIQKIKSKLQRAFKVWLDASRIRKGQDNSGLDGLLSARIRFLTTNTSLHNAKEKVSVGIFFSNREITDLFQLKKLDQELEELIAANKEIMTRSLAERLQKYSFQKGFKEKRFSRFDLQKLRRISACWGDINE